MRPFVSGGCYVNYCVLDLGNGYAKAYWGDNLPRLMKIKAEVDPKNIFKHAQSVPLS
jgi:FAD/FMN-containing dehydrogenase